MSERDSVTQAREEAARGKGGKGKGSSKRSKSDTSPGPQADAPAESRPSENRRRDDTRDTQTVDKIRERAYGLFEERGREHGHELEHWLEAERQITGSADRCDR
jgi:hypothetical protein